MKFTDRGLAFSRRIGWGFGDQALSSLTNFFVSVTVARVSTAAGFGAFSLTLASYAMSLGLSRAVATETLVIRHSDLTVGGRKANEAAAVAAAFLVGLACGLCCALIGLFVDPAFSRILFVLAACMPGLLMQDAWRVVYFVRGEGSKAFLNDLIWFGCMAPIVLALLFLIPSVGPVWITLIWGIAGCVAAGVGCLQVGIVPSLSDGWRWLRANWDLSSRYAAETLTMAGTIQAYFLLIGAVAGLAAVGDIKLVLVVLGPVNIVVQGIGMVALPEVVRASQRSKHAMDLSALATSAIVVAGALAWALLVWIVPSSLWVTWVGPLWISASTLVVPLVVLQVLNGANTGFYMGIRATRQISRGLKIRVFSSLGFLVFSVLGAVRDGAVGAAWGLAIAALLNLWVWAIGYMKSRRCLAAVSAPVPVT